MDALPLLVHKIAPGQFDLSYRFSHISLRDQMVRAQMLVRTLLEIGLVNCGAPQDREDFQLLICGAGMAGLAAAKEAAARGISFVLIERNSQIPGGVLASKASRYVSTGMYEWPHPNHARHDYPLSAPDLLAKDVPPGPTLKLPFAAPVLIQNFALQVAAAMGTDLSDWKRNFQDLRSGAGKLASSHLADMTTLSAASKASLRQMLNNKVSIHGVPLDDSPLPPVELDHAGMGTSTRGLRFRYVLYAVGFAQETNEYAEGKEPFPGYEHVLFWDRDSIAKPRLGFAKPPCIGVLGSGDGAMQDALRCLVKPTLPHALAAWDQVMTDPASKVKLRDSLHVRKALAEVAAADSYTTAGAIWTHGTHIFESLDEIFTDIIVDLIGAEGAWLIPAVDGLIRNDVGKVTLVNQRGYFTKAYALNRFMVLLLRRVLEAPTSKHRGKFEILSGEVTRFAKTGSNLRGATIDIKTTNRGVETRDCDLVVIRGGLDRTASPTQLIGLTDWTPGEPSWGAFLRPYGQSDPCHRRRTACLADSCIKSSKGNRANEVSLTKRDDALDQSASRSSSHEPSAGSIPGSSWSKGCQALKS